MKAGRYPIASIVLVILIAAKLAVRFFFPERYDALMPVLDGILLGVAIIFTLYYVKVFVTSWRDNKRENTGEQP